MNAAAEADHHECNDRDTSGCSLCNIRDPSTSSPLESHLPEPSRASQRSCLPEYTKDEYDYKLEEALLDWREGKTVAIYGWACLVDNGPVVMTNATLDRIVDCAHYRKMQTCEDLKRETWWIDIDEFGDEVINLIQQHSAPTTSAGSELC